MAGRKKALKHILIVEDDIDMQILYGEIFGKVADKYSVKMESDATTAYTRLSDKKIDLVILDIVMEPLPGNMFFTFLRNNKKTRNIPVLVVSVLKPAELAHMKKAGRVRFLQKPVSEKKLLSRVKSMIS